ncbi:nicotinate-nucleotide--dimethylbenzimidazole phosphoribosyltransferase [Gluconacetobacter entanii]|uniref:nicotinate-nucleotide--dimethylbenzimidazole phosphoribosyltransferase n=1 Tax=Gluconacetobacter entanii TaxID=108528 RepID=UPI001C9357EB|nr:nicotinate-nucleotide--dimethylbenzimidazole phosphoribosyltransferase [Gluconacetobacter entanii]MBY4639530.1 nicotinate-nucleotide--dimethylbenzimidazole phosphoribosyltransferase [Gluconacetobacter entanii]MCW4579879.1 nicotinate-nucleotide--dimethylbenzimidazole phosphoribosyltransferase [Gluconacetobacter entanii]MCW4583324.1 nicotinate-nucleotide--dimethylbenzimidazole phosphoribosyltransferase [Gluconacetobacter entanii]MCW4586675.1 nicotinate-nucleotide--dimethylbenzimidazole phospho
MTQLRAACRDMPPPDASIDALITERDLTLTKPPGSLGRLERLTAWMGRWQGRARPTLDHVRVIVFAGNHGVVAQGVSPWPASVTAQMVANFEAGGAAINQIARIGQAELRVVPLMDLHPTADFTRAPAMTEAAFLNAVTTGMNAVGEETDLLCLGEMGIGNTTAASAVAAGLFGGHGAQWAGRGTGLDRAGVVHKGSVIDRALALHEGVLDDPLLVARMLGGYELAAIMGAVLAARWRGIPVVLDGFVCTAAAAPLARLHARGLDHTVLSHCSAESGHVVLARALGLSPLLDFGLRLGEASGAALVIPLLRSALACHTGMATFAQARVSGRA